MIIVPYQEILEEKFERQKKIPNLERHASGHCLHIGEISPGCRGCFTPESSIGIQVGSQCMFKCPYCYYDPMRAEQPREEIDNNLANLFYSNLNPNFRTIIFAFQSTGETLLYLNDLERFAKLIDQIEGERKMNFYRYLYTNGVLATKENLKRLKSWGIREIRFHLAASGFSERVYKNMEAAITEGFTATVELPSLPHYRENLFKMLPIVDKMGVKHLNLVECQVTPFNIKNMHNIYPDGRAYQDFYIHLYDEGLVYDIIEEALAKNYGFSVLDCNSGVERCRQGPGSGVFFDMDSIKGMCAEWDYYNENKA